MSRRAAAMVGMVVVVVFWGLNYVVTKIGVSYLPPADFVFWRFLGTAAVTAPWMAKKYPRSARDLGILLILGFFGVSLYQWLFNTALHLTQAANVAFLFDVSPLLTILGQRVLGGRPIRPGTTTGAVISLVGVALLVGASPGKHWAGDGWALLSAVGWSGFTLITDKFRPAVTGVALTGWMSLFGSLGLLPFVHLTRVWREGPAVGLSLAYTVVLVTALGLTLWRTAVVELGGARANLFLYFIPVVAAAGGWVFLGEALTWAAALGALFILAGVAFAEGLWPGRWAKAGRVAGTP